MSEPSVRRHAFILFPRPTIDNNSVCEDRPHSTYRCSLGIHHRRTVIQAEYLISRTIWKAFTAELFQGSLDGTAAGDRGRHQMMCTV